MDDPVNQFMSAARSAWLHRWKAAGAAWLVGAAGWTTVTLMPDEYESHARVYVDAQGVLKPLLSGMTTLPDLEQQVAIMSKTLLSRPNLERVLRMVDLDIAAATPREHEEQLGELARRIKLGGTQNYNIYTISYTAPDRIQARNVVQSLLTIFLEGSYSGKRSESAKAVQFIDDQIKSYEQKLVAAETAVKDYKMRHAALLPRQGADYSTQLNQSADALGAARLELEEATRMREILRVQAATQAGSPTPPRTAENAVADLESRIAALRKSLDGLRLQFTEQHPDIVSAHRLLAQLEQRLTEERAREKPLPEPEPGMLVQELKLALARTDAQVGALQARVREYSARHERLKARVSAVPEVESQLTQLNRDYEINKANYEKLIGKREAAKLSGEVSTNTDMLSFRIIDPPFTPLFRSGPDRPLLYSLVLVAALLAAPAAAILANNNRPTFSGPSQIRSVTQLPVLGTVSLVRTIPWRRQRRRQLAGFALATAPLFFAYAALMVRALRMD
jgi:polysaccharide chain length determinant protein (PEP-CTERM system associated)